MNDLLENLKRFLEAGDEQRSYVLNRDEVRCIVHEIEKLRSRELKILSFADIRDEIHRQKAERTIPPNSGARNVTTKDILGQAGDD